MRRVRSLFILLTLILARPSHAQMDPSTRLLLRRPSAAPPVDTLDEEHYSVRPPRPTARPRPAIIITPAPSPEALLPVGQTRPAAEFGREPAATDASEDSPAGEDALSLRVGAGYLDLDARSSDPRRQTSGGGAALNLGITLWATPTFGIKADYVSGLGTTVRRDQTNFGWDHQEIDAALMYRRPWGRTHLDLSVGYHQISNQITRAANAPFGTRSRGADVGAAWTIPAGDTYAHVIEAHLQPILDHAELGARGTGRANPSNTSFGGSLGLGGRYEVDHDRDLFWRARYTFEQNIFTNGPTVTTGQAWLVFGVEWGS